MSDDSVRSTYFYLAKLDYVLSGIIENLLSGFCSS